jgi:hypothetical protein
MGLLVRGNGGRGAARSQTRTGERGWGPKTRNRARWLGFGSVVLNNGGGRWWILVGLLARRYGGRGTARSQTQAGERGWGP